VKERGIMMSAPMVRATRRDLKLQTRRAVKKAWVHERQHVRVMRNERTGQHWAFFWNDGDQDALGVRCPYGQPGDRLYVKEAWAVHWMYDDLPPSKLGTTKDRLNGDNVWYRADPEGTRGSDDCPAEGRRGRWRSSMFMPRWASRITLEITGVRVDRLQDISEEDAKAEGVEPYKSVGADQRVPGPGFNGVLLADQPHRLPFADLWDRIHGDGSWVLNPWVWVVEFKRVAQEARAA
jgi:hypothetical protein